MSLLKSFGISFLFFMVLDFIWLGSIVKDFNLRPFAEIGRIKDGQFELLYAPAVFAYLMMALSVSLFVLP